MRRGRGRGGNDRRYAGVECFISYLLLGWLFFIISIACWLFYVFELCLWECWSLVGGAMILTLFDSVTWTHEK